MIRPRPLTLALIALGSAAGFLIIRLGYRMVFGGAAGEGDVLFEIPRYRLGGVFSHIPLGGEVTTGGVADALLSGLPFASIILISALLVTMWDPRGVVLYLPRLRHTKALVLAVSIAVSTIPLLASLVGETRRAARLRGVKPGRRILLPVVEKTLEHATGLHATLEARGVVLEPASEGPGRSEPGLISLRGITWPERGLDGVSLTVEPGSLTVLTGATGSGKTTLLECIAGVNSARLSDVEGLSSHRVAYLPHQPHTLFLTSTVCDDVTLSYLLAGFSRDTARARATQLLGEWGLLHLASSHPCTLSAGEAVLAGCALLMATDPTLLVLDEPLGSLDPQWRSDLLSKLVRYQQSGIAIILADHRSVELDRLQATVYTLDSAGLHPGAYQPPQVDSPPMLPRPLPDPDVVARFSGLRADYATLVVFENVDLSLRRGLATVVCGANGAGKTTLLHTVADTAAGGVDEVALVPSEPHDFFFTDSVAQELSLADRAARCAPGTTKTTLESILSGQWRESVMATIATTHPRDLSRGQRTALAIAIQMSHRPRVLALDEPTRGLDQAATEALVEVLHCAAETGVAMLIATQEPKVFASLPGDTWELASGTLSPLSEVTR